LNNNKFNKLNSVNNPKSIHGIFPYRGKISPIDVNNILHKFGVKNKRVLDPFCGTGTILIEASKMNNKTIGIDVNPIAFLLSQAKIKIQNFKKELKNFKNIKEKVKKNSNILNIPTSIKDNFHIKTAREIMSYSFFFNKMSSYLKGCFMGAIALSARGCNHYVWTSNIVGKKIKPFRYINFEKTFFNKIKKHYYRSNKNIKVFNIDARHLAKTIKKDSIDVVITSPPYFNALDYTSYHNRFVIDILKLNKTKIKMNLIQNIKSYKEDMIQVFNQLKLVTKKKSKIIFIVGDKKEKDGKINKGSNFFTSIAPFKKYRIIERKYTNTSSQVIDKINKTSRKEQIIIWEK
jgi:DNA modification methylase